MPRVKSVPRQPQVRPAVAEWSTYARVLGWRGIVSLGLQAGDKVKRRSYASLDLICELPAKWKPRRLVISIERGAFGRNVDCEAVSVMLGDKQTYNMFLPLIAEEFDVLIPAITCGQAWQVSISSSKPSYRRALVYDVHVEAGSDASHLSPPADILFGSESALYASAVGG